MKKCITFAAIAALVLCVIGFVSCDNPATTDVLESLTGGALLFTPVLDLEEEQSNVASGAVVGNFAAGNSYGFVDDAVRGADNGAFVIAGNELRVGAAALGAGPKFIYVKATKGAASFSVTASLYVAYAGGPRDFGFTQGEHINAGHISSEAGKIVGVFTDPASGEGPFSYTFAGGNGVNDADNNRFDIFDYDLAVKSSLTEKRDYRIYVRITDNAQRVYAKEFTVAPGERPLPPTARNIDDEMVTVLAEETTIAGSDGYGVSDGNAARLVTVFCGGRNVTIVPYSMAKYTVTYGQWYEVVQWATAEERGGDRYTFINAGQPGSAAPAAGAGGAPTDEEKDMPVIKISWRDAMVWCNALSEYTGKEPVYYYRESDGSGVARTSSADAVVAADITTKSNLDAAKFKIDRVEMNKTKNGYRLPTEAEWEFAARNGTIPATVPESIPEDADYMWKYAGTNEAALLWDYAWFSSNSNSTIQSVGRKNPNKLDLYDLTGNLKQWCWDWYIEGSTSDNTRYTVTSCDYGIGNDGGTWEQKKDTVTNAGYYGRVARSTFVNTVGTSIGINAYSQFAPNNIGNNEGFRIACTVTP